MAATDDNGIVQAIQRIYLDANAQPLVLGNKKKTTNGSLDGCAVRLPGPADKPLLLAEGPETRLSVWAATGYETWVSLGAVGKLSPSKDGRTVVVCRDDDAPDSPADKALSRARAQWRKAGLHVAVATPWSDRRGDASDFNDVRSERRQIQADKTIISLLCALLEIAGPLRRSQRPDFERYLCLELQVEPQSRRTPYAGGLLPGQAAVSRPDRKAVLFRISAAGSRLH